MIELTTYVSGSTSINGIEIATYWKDEVDTQCTDGRFNARGNSIFVDGNDIYLAGYECNANGHKVAKYWKNGHEVVLSDGTANAMVQSIFVQKGDVYAAGTDLSKSGAIYWKNGVAVKLEGNVTTSEAHSIFVMEDDIHVTGYDYLKGAIYWRNGVAKLLAGGPAAHAHSIVVCGKDTYIAGIADNSAGYSGAMCWKNGVATELTKDAGCANAVCSWHNNVFIAGKMLKGSEMVSVYWKEGVPTELPAGLKLTENSHNIHVAYNQIYMAVNGLDAHGRNIGKYWKDGVITDLTKGLPSLATGIFVL